MNISKCIVLSLFAALSTAPAHGESFSTASSDNVQAFKNLDLSVTAGTTGIGLDVATPLNKNLQVRGGFAFMPHFHHTMNFDIQVGDHKESKYNEKGERVESRFDRLSKYLKDFTGYEVDDEVDMIGKPTYYNFKLMLDWFPFRKKNWHFTAGAFIGNSRIAKAYNTTEDMPSLVAVGIYNNLYEKVLNEEPVFGNVELPPDICDKFMSYGRMGIHVGDHVSDGSPYMMEPDANSMVKASVKVNSFKPYVGFGYGSAISKDKKLHASFDCGTMFWGGTPQIITHDGTNLAKDVRNIDGKVGDYVDLIKGFKVFPVINLRVTYRIF